MRERQRRSIRLANYDYTSAGAYFVTICAAERELVFQDSGAQVAVMGAWTALPEHFFRVVLGEFIIMPNHVHGLIWLQSNDGLSPAPVGAQHAAPLRSHGVQSGSLGAIVRSFKSAVNRGMRRHNLWDDRPLWQRNYYERIIRNEAELKRIRQYIHDNPMKWQLDRENPDRIVDRLHDRDWAWLESHD